MSTETATTAWPIVDRRLDNGLRVVVSPDHLAPVVAVNVWYGVGSRHEVEGRTGFAHLFEHLMFQGSRNVASGEHFSTVMGVGGTLNGTTSFDRTNYFETVPRHAFELALWLEADRMGTLLDAVDQANLDNQRDVVKNERRQRYDNVPYGTAWERLFALTYPQGHPYHHLPIGSMEDLDAAALEDVHAFFTTWYAPRNATVAIVGDVEADEALAAAERCFGGIPAGQEPPPARDGALDPLDREVREEIVDDVPADAVYALHRLPAEGHPDVEAADLATRILADGEASRLVRRLEREEQLAQRASAFADRLIGGTSTAGFVLRVRSGASLDALVDAFDGELRRLAVEPPTEAEVDRALALAERDWLRSTGTVAGRADALARAATLHDDPAFALTDLDRLRGASPDDVADVTSRYLDPGRRALLVYRRADAEAAVAARTDDPPAEDVTAA